MLPTAQNEKCHGPGVGLDTSDEVTSCFDFTTRLFGALWQVVTAAGKQTGGGYQSEAEHAGSSPVMSDIVKSFHSSAQTAHFAQLSSASGSICF